MIAIFFKWFCNTALFYVGWLLTLKLVLNDSYLLAPLAALAVVIIHLFTLAKPALFELLLICSLALLGSLLDTTLGLLAILKYRGGYECCSWLAPPWVTSLWALFATSLNHSFSWLQRQKATAALLGAIGGTLSYLAAIKAGAAVMLLPLSTTTIILAIAWGIALPLSFLYNDWLKKKWQKSR